MIAVLIAELITSILGALSAIAMVYLLDGGSQGGTTSCILVVAGVAGRVFRTSQPNLPIWSFLKGSVVFLISLVLLLAGLGRLDLRSAQALAGWYNQWRVGPSVGFLIFQLAFVPLPFCIGASFRRRLGST